MKNLQPGYYLQQGDNLKMLNSPYLSSILGESTAPTNPETLAAAVAWVFIALEKRRGQIEEIPHQWRQGDKDLDEAPIDEALFARIDTALQLYNKAYLLKARSGNRVEYVRWLDPAEVTPDLETAQIPYGVRQYRYGTRFISADDIIDFSTLGMRELIAAPAPAAATSLAAQVLFGMDSTQDSIFDNNALPISLVIVKDAMTIDESDKGRLRSWWSRVTNPKKRGAYGEGNRVEVMGGNIEIQQLSLAPEDLAFDAIGPEKRLAILAAHSVPESIATSNAANFATAQIEKASFVMTMGQRLQKIANVLNKDADFVRGGYTLHVNTNQHPAMKRDEQAASVAMMNYVTAGLTPEAAFYLTIGYAENIFPEDFGSVFALPVLAEVSGDENFGDIKAADKPPISPFADDLRKWQSKAYKAMKRGKSPAVKFETDKIPWLVKTAIDAQLEEVKKPEHLAGVFEGAMAWESYP